MTYVEIKHRIEQVMDLEKQTYTQSSLPIFLTASTFQLCPDKIFFLSPRDTQSYQLLFHYALMSNHIYSCYGLNCIPFPPQNILKF